MEKRPCSSVTGRLAPEALTAFYQSDRRLTPDVVTVFRQSIYDYYRANPRPMPWRETSNPYHILVSEIMLQQTQVERVRIKYEAFLAAFPTPQELARVPLSEVLRIWQGLGYNRRAIALQRCAQEIEGRFAGRFPAAIDDLQSLPGIGPYTARALAAFAFGVAEPMIETNIRTVFIHYFFHGQAAVRDDEIMPLVAVTLDLQNPREWYYALMDYGVFLKQQHPNPGRRSRHYARQSAFEGSNRQLRSIMLRAVMKCPGISLAQLLRKLDNERDAVEKNLAVMVKEGFLKKDGVGYHIAT